MTRKSPVSKALALLVIVGPMALLGLGLAYNTLSVRALVIGILTYWVAILLLAVVRKQAAQSRQAKDGDTAPGVMDDRARRRILRGIRINKVWVAALVILLPIGIANGVIHHAWLPTLCGGGVSLFLIYAEIQWIKRRRKLLNCTR